MGWKETITGPASFRGVPFFVDTSELSSGRKIVVHEYPFRDQPFVEDLGRRARSFAVEGYVIGDDYITKRDALLAALETSGPGSLVHPYYGTRLVAVGTLRVQESREEGGWAKFRIEFEETEARAFAPSVASAPLGKVNASADSALTASGNAFTSRYALTIPQSGSGVVLPGAASKSLPSFTLDSITGVITSYTAKMRSVLSPVISGTQNLARFKSQIDAIVLDVDNLVREPLELVSRFRDVFTSLLDMPSTPRIGVRALLEVYGFVSTTPRPVAVTATRAVEQTNYDAVDTLLRDFAIIQAARLATTAAAITRSDSAAVITRTSEIEASDGTVTQIVTVVESLTGSADPAVGYDSYEDAVSVRDEISDALDTQAEAVDDDDAYIALVQLRTELIAALPGPRSTLPHLVTFTPPNTVPSLVLAYQLYGAVNLEADMLSRNSVRHPGFVAGDQALQVLSHA